MADIVVSVAPTNYPVTVSPRVWRANISGARGESAADIARRLLSEPPYDVPGAGDMSDLDALEAIFGAPQSFLPQTLSWILAVEAHGETPSFERMRHVDLLMKDLVALDAWSHCDGIFAEGETLWQTATNLISPGTTATIEGDPVHVADRYLQAGHYGEEEDWLSAWIDTEVAIPAAHFTQNSAFMLARQVSATTDNQNPLIGTSQGRSSVIAMTAQERVRFNANATTEDDSEAQIPNGIGAFGWIRSDATHFQPMIGALASGDPVAKASASIVTAGNTMLLMKAGAQIGSGRAVYWAFGGGAGVTVSWYGALVRALEKHIRRTGAWL